MIVKCAGCSRKFIVRDIDIPKEGRNVQCGYCSIIWHQLPISQPIDQDKKPKLVKPSSKSVINEKSPSDIIKASDGKTYKFLGNQWAQLYPSGKTGLFAQKKIGQELNKLTGKKVKNTIAQIKRKELDPSSEGLSAANQLPDVYSQKRGLGFFGYMFLIIILSFFIIGILKTFENDLINYFPETQYFFIFIDEQIVFVMETIKNIIVILKDLTASY